MTTKATLITAMAAFADIISYHVDIYIYDEMGTWSALG